MCVGHLVYCFKQSHAHPAAHKLHQLISITIKDMRHLWLHVVCRLCQLCVSSCTAWTLKSFYVSSIPCVLSHVVAALKGNRWNGQTRTEAIFSHDGGIQWHLHFIPVQASDHWVYLLWVFKKNHYYNVDIILLFLELLKKHRLRIIHQRLDCTRDLH